MSRTSTDLASGRTLASHGAFILPYLEPGQRVLDCGCGPGTITLGLADAVFPGRVTGIDRSSFQTDRAHQLANGREIVNASFRTADVYDLPWADGTFDLVFSHALFEHLSQPERALAELGRVLKPGGLIGLCSPDWRAFRFQPQTLELKMAIEACRRLQEDNGGNTAGGGLLEDWLKNAGFQVLSKLQRNEVHADTQRIAAHLASQLEEAGHGKEARDLRAWAGEPRALFSQAWISVVAVK
jgi:ubiquinone/menaquinone biosynthesis C-methylase UbiE